MQIAMIRAKIHQARVTAADLNYVGSIGLDTELMDAAGIYPYEKVLVVDLENGNRLETYTIPATAGSGEVQPTATSPHCLKAAVPVAIWLRKVLGDYGGTAPVGLGAACIDPQ